MQYHFIIGCLLMALNINAQRTNFDENWQFIQADIQGAEQADFDDATWRTLHLPHDWSIEGDYSAEHPMGDRCGYLPAGIGWYRKTIAVPTEWKGQHIEIEFDGVFHNSTVWANGQKLGYRPYGWVSFAYDISEIAQNADSITFAVRVDNDLQPSARWYTGSGIYGHTWLSIKNKIHIPKDGIFIRTKGSTVNLDVEVKNTTTRREKKVCVKTKIQDPKGRVIATQEKRFDLAEGAKDKFTQRFILEAPHLWSPKTPNLYTALTEVWVGKQLLDQQATRFGVRDIEWKVPTGMWLNGKNIKLVGVCNHQDAGPLGAAVPDKILRYRILQLKKMGVNAIRTAHNPQTPVFYDLCDELGMLVMDEIFDGWGRKAPHDYGAYHFDEWWKKDLTDWVKRDRNHPSVVIYSVGNETKGAVAPELVAQCHLIDPTRPVTSGHSGSEHMDILGINGHSEQYGFLQNELQADEFFIGTENTHSFQVRGYYRTKSWFRNGYPSKKKKPYPLADLTGEEVFKNDWTTELNRANGKQIFNSSYDNAMIRLTARRNLQQLRDTPNFAGSFRWTGYDYLGEAGFVHGGFPFKAFMGGAIDLANFEKDLYYLYQSQWTKEPMVHILPHWTHPQIEKGVEIPVWVYSNCETVELFFDGQSLGKQQPGKDWDKMQCQWMVGWRPAELKAIGYRQGKKVTETTIRTASAPTQIALSVDGESLSVQSRDIVQVRVSTQDAQGTFYPYGENRTYFYVLGAGKIRALGNGSPIDVESHYNTNNRIAFYGLTRAFIESTTPKSDIALVAGCIIGEKRQITSDLVHIDTEILPLRGAAPNPTIEVFYTLDGTNPTTKSTAYEKAFPVALGTTVKALVMLNGQAIYTMEERFANDAGFEWEVESETELSKGEQAEKATFKNAKPFFTKNGFKGHGYLEMGQKAGAYVEWYQENDGGEDAADLLIRYSGKVKEKLGAYFTLTINGKVIDDQLLLRNTENGEQLDWRYAKVPFILERGANTIRLTTNDRSGFYIDEILVE